LTGIRTRFFAKIATEYLDEIAAQTRGSYRVKKANERGARLVSFLNIMAGTSAEQSISGYIARARVRLELAGKCGRQDHGQGDRVRVAALLLERLAFDDLLKLDQMEALGAIQRVRRCARCESWFWSRVDSQRYCSERCRVRHYQTSPDGKRYKRHWARKNYRRNKRRDEEARLLAKSLIRDQDHSKVGRASGVRAKVQSPASR
jgi:hypothetical protein